MVSLTCQFHPLQRQDEISTFKKTQNDQWWLHETTGGSEEINHASQQTTWWQNCCLHCADYPTKLRNVCGSSSLKVPACTGILLLTAVFLQYTHFHMLLNTSLVSASQTVQDLSRLITCNCNFSAGVIHVISLHSIYSVSSQKCHNCKYNILKLITETV